MKTIGVLLACAGVIYLLFAFNMDVSVSTPSTYIPGIGSVGGGEVANLDLMARRQNHIIIAALMTLLGVLIAVFGPSGFGPKSEETDQSTGPTTRAVYMGRSDLGEDAYRLWLAKAHSIERNDVFQKFVMGDRTFDSLDEALSAAHQIELERDAEALATKQAAEERLAAIRAAHSERMAQSAADFEEMKPKLIAGAIIVGVLVVGGIWFLRETPEERAARVAEEARAQMVLLAETEKEIGLDLPDDLQNFEVRPPEESDAGFCQDESSFDAAADASGHHLIHFDTSMSPEALRKRFAKTLGEGRRKYASLPDTDDWKWEKGETLYTLGVMAEGDTTSATLCVEER